MGVGAPRDSNAQCGSFELHSVISSYSFESRGHTIWNVEWQRCDSEPTDEMWTRQGAEERGEEVNPCSLQTAKAKDRCAKANADRKAALAADFQRLLRETSVYAPPQVAVPSPKRLRTSA